MLWTNIVAFDHAQSGLLYPRHHPAQAVTLMIGPEGGFNEAEEKFAIQQGALALSIGSRILRTETAGIAAMSVLSAAWGGI